MRHARPDYNRFQDPAGIIPADEPVFIIRGQDIAAPAAIRSYAHHARSNGANSNLFNTCMAWADEVERWQKANKAKVPDLPAPKPEWKPTHRHYKGWLYRLLRDDLTIEATMTPAVLYENADGRAWVRPKDEFFGNVAVDGQTVRRFAPIEQA